MALVGFCGHAGSGKTTVINSLSGNIPYAKTTLNVKSTVKNFIDINTPLDCSVEILFYVQDVNSVINMDHVKQCRKCISHNIFAIILNKVTIDIQSISRSPVQVIVSNVPAQYLEATSIIARIKSYNYEVYNAHSAMSVFKLFAKNAKLDMEKYYNLNNEFQDKLIIKSLLNDIETGSMKTATGIALLLFPIVTATFIELKMAFALIISKETFNDWLWNARDMLGIPQPTKIMKIKTVAGVLCATSDVSPDNDVEYDEKLFEDLARILKYNRASSLPIQVNSDNVRMIIRRTYLLTGLIDPTMLRWYYTTAKKFNVLKEPIFEDDKITLYYNSDSHPIFKYDHIVQNGGLTDQIKSEVLVLRREIYGREPNLCTKTLFKLAAIGKCSLFHSIIE